MIGEGDGTPVGREGSFVTNRDEIPVALKGEYPYFVTSATIADFVAFTFDEFTTFGIAFG